MAFEQLKPSIGDLSRLSGLWQRHPRYSGCVGHWLFNENQGGIAHDISGYQNNGMLTNMDLDAVWVNTAFGTALKWSATSTGYVIVPGSQYNLHDVSVCVWFYRDITNPKSAALVDYFQHSGNSWALWSSFSNVYILDDIDNQNETLYSTTTSNFTWHLLVGTMKDLVNTLYLNNTVLGTGDTSTDDWASIDAAGLYIGSSDGGLTSSYRDWISEVRIYNRALSAAEVASMYYFPFLEFTWAQRHLQQYFWSLGAARFHEYKYAIEDGMKPRQAAGMGGILVE